MWQEFKSFLIKQNAIALAIAVVSAMACCSIDTGTRGARG